LTREEITSYHKQILKASTEDKMWFFDVGFSENQIEEIEEYCKDKLDKREFKDVTKAYLYIEHRIFSKMHIKLRFKVHDVRGGDAYTYFIGHDTTSDYTRRLTRRKKSRTDGTFDVMTKDDNLVRIKPMAIAERRIQSSKQSAVRKRMGDIVKSEASGKTLSELVRAMIMGEMAKKIAVACRSIQPLQRVEIRKSELMRISKLPDIPEKAPEEEPEEPPAPEEPGEGEEPAEEVPEESEAAEETPEEAPEEAPEEPEVTEEPAEASEETVEPAEEVEEEEPVES